MVERTQVHIDPDFAELAARVADHRRRSLFPPPQGEVVSPTGESGGGTSHRALQNLLDRSETYFGANCRTITPAK